MLSAGMIELTNDTSIAEIAPDLDVPITPSLIIKFLDRSQVRIESGPVLVLDSAGREIGRYTADKGLSGDWKGLIGADVKKIQATEDGRLIVECSDFSITAHPDPDYEAWTYVRESREMVVALPGGGIAVWGYPEE